MTLVKNVAKSKTLGFTLIEVLIGLTLLSIMTVLLFTSLKICADSWERGEKKIASVNEMAVVYHFFQEHLSVAKPILNESLVDEKPFSFQGGVTSLQFVSNFPESVGKQGLQIFTVALVEEDNTANINVKVTPYNAAGGDADEESEVDDVILLKHVSEFKLSYFGSEDGMSDGVWLDDWLNKSVLPLLVKVNIVLENGSYWPEMIIPLKITAPDHNANNPNDGAGIIP
ncbi:MAG: prepilin-type N-terminal cleavage/methylation domain-containing protein [Methylococcales bacterium]|nr:prepilin-type N-terminal cleavage/methylation domain-containing protein [Methylococcales bacterium]